MADVFDPQLFRENAELAISKLEEYLADSSVRGLELSDRTVLLQAAKDLMTEEHERVARLDARCDLLVPDQRLGLVSSQHQQHVAGAGCFGDFADIETIFFCLAAIVVVAVADNDRYSAIA